ncbi:MAG TPA: aminoglycoside phosphotransferase family protein [Iamia sp.]|nr:aminoglycoside phosphotransferase family protein [Iamia sp.]
MPNRMHDDQVGIDGDIVRALIADQHPRWADLPLVEVPSIGTVNAVYRLGDELCVRLPLKAGGVGSLERELERLPWLAARLPVAVPEPVATGAPDDAYPLPWAIYRWLPGTTADGSGGAALADDLAAAVTAIRALDPTGAPRAGGRWTLAAWDPTVGRSLGALGGVIDVERAGAAWAAAVAAPPWDGPPTWVHGDLLAANLLVADGRLAAVIDWGGAGTGDPAADLLPAWSGLDATGRVRLRTVLDPDDATWTRGQGWALRTALSGLPYYPETNPGFAAMAAAMLAAVLADRD